MARVGGLVLGAACAGALLIPAPASAGPNHQYCGNVAFTLGSCAPPPAPAQPTTYGDPGGNEVVDGPVPPPIKRFGFSANTNRWGIISPEKEAELVALAGANAHRIAVTWQWMQYRESDPPLMTTGANPAAHEALEWLDRRYAALLRENVTPILHVIEAPAWASRFSKPCPAIELKCPDWKRNSANWINNSDDPATDYPGYYFPDADHLDDYEAFHTALATRYPKADFEGWNEPNLYYNTEQERPYEPWAPSPEEFNAIQCRAYKAVERVDPARRFIGPSYLHRSWDHFKDYVNRTFAAGAADCADAFTTHVYHSGQLTFGTGSRLARVLTDVRAMKAFHGDGDPIWITETGWPTAGTSTWEIATDEPGQALGARRAYNRLTSMPDIGGVFFHTLADPVSSGHPVGDVERHFGFLRADLAPKPAYCGFVLRAGNAYSGC